MEDKKENLRSTFIKGSEEVYDFVCEPCSTENNNREAAGFCQTCAEYLCETCSKCHAKLSATKSHTLLDKNMMPKQKLPPKVKDVLTEKCSRHTDKVIEYFCINHSQLACSVCVNTIHKSCPDTPYIPEISGDILASSQTKYKHLQDDLDRLATTATVQQHRFTSKGKMNDEYRSNVLANINQVRTQLNEYLDQMEKTVKQKTTELHTDNARAIQAVTKQYQAVLSDVTTMSSALMDMAAAGKTNQLFVLVQLFSRRVSDIQRHQMSGPDSLDIIHFEFDSTVKLQKIKSVLSDIWSLSVQQTAPVTKATFEREIDIECADDNENCKIYYITVLTGGRVIVADGYNEAVKLFDINQNELLSRLQMSSSPSSVIETKQNTVAVSVYKEYKIELLRVSDILSRIKVLHVPGASIAELCYNGKVFIGACLDPGSVKMINMSGKVVKTIDENSNGEILFIRPWCLAISRDLTILHVADCAAHSISTLTMDGQVLSVYKSDSLQVPAGITVGRHGEVYVCSRSTHTIHQLSSTGQFIRVILGKNQNLAMEPGVIAHSEDNNILYVSSLNGDPKLRNYIRVFQLE